GTRVRVKIWRGLGLGAEAVGCSRGLPATRGPITARGRTQPRTGRRPLRTASAGVCARRSSHVTNQSASAHQSPSPRPRSRRRVTAPAPDSGPAQPELPVAPSIPKSRSRTAAATRSGAEPPVRARSGAARTPRPRSPRVEDPAAGKRAGVRIYVLDTSVLLSDPRAIRRFAEHEVVLPLVVISEL